MVLIAEIFSQDYRSNPQRGFSLAFVARSFPIAIGKTMPARSSSLALRKNFRVKAEFYLETNGNNPR